MDKDSFPKILGTATVNDKGQIVIPVEARNTLDLKPGSRLVIMSGHRRPALVIIKAEDVEQMVRNLSETVENLKSTQLFPEQD